MPDTKICEACHAEFTRHQTPLELAARWRHRRFCSPECARVRWSYPLGVATARLRVEPVVSEQAIVGMAEHEQSTYGRVRSGFLYHVVQHDSGALCGYEPMHAWVEITPERPERVCHRCQRIEPRQQGAGAGRLTDRREERP